MKNAKIGVLLSGCGVYDGSEIQETVLTFLALEEQGATIIPIGIDGLQHHVINHITGEEMPESRNMMIESARISRGSITPIQQIQPADLDALVIPGGFGNAKNLTTWAFNGLESAILPEVKLLLVNLVNVGKPIVALCVSPVVLAKAFEGSAVHASLTIGTSEKASPYDIHAFSAGIEKLGAQTHMKTVGEIHIDVPNKIITAPCYMMEASMLEIRKNIQQAIQALADLLDS